MDQGQKDALIAQKLARAKAAKATGAAPVKKPSRPAKAKAAEIPAGQVVGNSVGLAAVCRTSGCSEQGQRKTFRVPALGKIALLPGGVMCLVCEKGMKFDMDDVQVDRVER